MQRVQREDLTPRSHRGGRRNGGAWAACALLLLPAGCGGDAEQAREIPANEVARELTQVRVEPGLWEQTTVIADVAAQRAPVELVTRMRERRSSARYCITPEQAAQPSANFLAGRQASRCTSRSFTMRDGQMSGEMSCSEPQGAQWSARLQGRYASDNYELEMTMEMPNPWDPAPMRITSRTSGRRLGDCEAPEAAGAKS